MNETTLTPAALPQKDNPPKFTATKLEGLCALLSFIPAYLYADRFWQPRHLAVIAAFIILLTELLNLSRKRSAESFVWLGCFVLCTLGAILERDGVWTPEQTFLFLHIFAIWWVLSRSGALLEGKSGHLLPVDAFNGFILIPFSQFFLRIRSLAFNLRLLFPKRGEENRRVNLWMIPAAMVCLLLFARAVSLLVSADVTFGSFLRRFTDFFRFHWDEETVLHILLSLPVGAWLFGLMGGSARLPEEKKRAQRVSVSAFLVRIRKIPAPFWLGVTGLFTLLYLGFFILQGTYLFGAFTRTLPEGFIVSQYAREGFFELCRVMAVNFTVLWLVTRLTPADASRRRLVRILCLVLLLESMLFAVIAFSKLYLYISCFGFTPKRLQSAWLVCVLFAGSLLWAYTLFTEKPVFRKWMFFGAVSLSILALV